MSKIVNLATDVSASAAAAQASVQLTDSPFVPPFRETLAMISTNAAAGAGLVIKIQGSEDDSTWTDLVTMTGVQPDLIADCECYPYMRANVTGAGTAGTYTARLVGGV